MFEKGTQETFTGLKADVREPNIGMICIEDIAHSLAMTCRFNGHCREFYSVGDHCLNMVSLARQEGCKNEALMSMLLHDATEAYIGDIITPIKVQFSIKDIEKPLLNTIIRALCPEGFVYHLERVWAWDKLMLRWEAFSLMRSQGREWFGEDYYACGNERLLIGTKIEEVESSYLYTYHDLLKGL